MSSIVIKSPREIELMRQAGRITAAARALARDMVTAGTTTAQIDKEIYRFIRSQGAVPTFKGYGGFPASACISINDEVIHGIPGPREIHEGDLVSIDVGATYKGYVGDCAASFIAGQGSEEAKHLLAVTRQSFYEGMKFARAGNRIGDISRAIQEYAEKNGCSVVRDYVGHGVGAQMHEAPEVPNFWRPGPNPRLLPGMTIAVEPMVNLGGWEVKVLKDGWTVKTADGSLSAHYENTILITDGEPEILTFTEDRI